jgi:hypothetical protein
MTGRYKDEEGKKGKEQCRKVWVQISVGKKLWDVKKG